MTLKLFHVFFFKFPKVLLVNPHSKCLFFNNWNRYQYLNFLFHFLVLIITINWYYKKKSSRKFSTVKEMNLIKISQIILQLLWKTPWTTQISKASFFIFRFLYTTSWKRKWIPLLWKSTCLYESSFFLFIFLSVTLWSQWNCIHCRRRVVIVVISVMPQRVLQYLTWSDQLL